MPESAESKGWPFVKAGRKCNLGDCTAFKLTPEDMDYHEEASRLMHKERMSVADIIKKIGYPQGTCLVKAKRVNAGVACTVEDRDFSEFYKYD